MEDKKQQTNKYLRRLEKPIKYFSSSYITILEWYEFENLNMFKKQNKRKTKL